MAPQEYFQRLVESFEQRMLMYRIQIEIMESHLASISQGQTLTPQGAYWACQQRICLYSGTLIIPTLIIQICRLSWLFLWSQFCHEYLLVAIKIRGHILWNYSVEKGSMGMLFHFQKAKAALVCVITNEEHSNDVWLAKICFVIGLFGMVSKINKPHSVTNMLSCPWFVNVLFYD